MHAAERFAQAVACPPEHVRLDVAAFCIAAAAHPGFDIDAACAHLDALARACPTPTFDGVRVYLFETLGYAGNADDYGDPENSFLDAVIERRIGIPITLSLLMMEIGRRVGVTVHGVGMPGHFLVRAGEDDVWCDPFHGGAVYDVDGCRELFLRVHGSASQFSRTLLEPTPPHAILARMLTNLEHGRVASDPRQLSWVCELHLALPVTSPGEHERLRLMLRSARARWN